MIKHQSAPHAASPVVTGHFVDRVPFRSAAVLALVLGFCCSTTRADADQVIVRLTDGTIVRADRIEPETDASHMRLSSERMRVVVSRKLAWKEIVSADVVGESFSRETLQTYFAANAKSIVTPVSQVLPIPPDALPHEPPGWPCDLAPPSRPFPPLPLEAAVLGVRQDPLDAYADLAAVHFPNGIPQREAAAALLMLREARFQQMLCLPPAVPEAAPALPPEPGDVEARAGTLATISARAFPISTTGKADWNALVVELTGLDAYGVPVPVQGAMQATLWGTEQELIPMYEELFLPMPGRVEEIAAWTRMIGDADPMREALQPARFVLPLPSPLPEHDLDLSPVADLHVKLLVPGSGVFETTACEVPLRQLSLARDRQFITTGTQFFPSESTSDSIRRRVFFRDYSSLGPNRRVFTVQP